MRDASASSSPDSRSTLPPARTLRRRAQTTLSASSPFHFVATVHKPSHFPTPTESLENETLRFTMTWRDSVLGIRMEHGDGGLVPVSIYADRPIRTAEVSEIVGELTFRFGLHLDLTEFVRMAASDPVLGPIETRWRGMRPSCAYGLYELLCITVVLQNATVRRSASMLGRLLETYGQRVRFDGRTLLAFFPPSRIASAPEAELRSLKVGYRAKTLRRVAEFFTSHEGFERDLRNASRAEAAARLLNVYGVGPASLWYLLFEGLKHVDAFDHVSPWEAKILGRLLFEDETVPPELVLRTAADRWGHWRMLAVHYLFEDVFWRRRTQSVPWLDREIRL